MNTPTNQRAACADGALLKRYIDDQLDPHEEADLAAHLSTCPECQAALESAGGNAAWWQGVRGEFLDGLLPGDAKLKAQDIGEQVLHLLAPTDDPRMLGRIGHYEVQGVVGQGSAGIVFRALDPRLNRTVAIKVLAPGLMANGPARTRFEREARAFAAVAHDHVVPIHAVDAHNGLPYIVMQYVSGSLRTRFQESAPLSTREVTRIGLQIAQALDAAHAQGIVHRDVKPGNVLVEGSVDRVMVTDFGLASVAGDASMTFSGTIHGTPHYMSPEQARGESVDARTDLFSLGSLFYEACTGRPPFQAQTVFGVIRRVCETEPTPIREVNPEIDEWLAALIGRLMAKDLRERFQTAAAVAEALGAELAYLQNPTGVTRPRRGWRAEPLAETKGSGWRIPPVVAIGCAALAFGGLGGLALSGLVGSDQDSQHPTSPREPTVAVAGDTDVRTLRRTLSDVAGEALSIRVAFGDVTIRAADTQDIVLEMAGVVDAETDEEAGAIFASHPVSLARVENGIELSGLLEDREGWRSLHYAITIPRGTDLDIATQGGDLIIGPVAGDLHIETEGGDVDLGRVEGDVDVHATGGDVFLLDGCAGDADLVVIRGDAAMANVGGEGFAITSGGDVWLGQSPGRTGAQTSGGDVYIDGVAGPVRVHATSGDIELWMPRDPNADVRVNAANGDVTLMVAADVNATLAASGELETDIPFEGDSVVDEAGATWATTTMHGGGATVSLSSMSGDVEIDVFESTDETLLSAMASRGRTPQLPQRPSRPVDPFGPSGSGTLGTGDGSPLSAGGSALGRAGSGNGGPFGSGGSGLGGSGLGGSGDGAGSSGLGGSGEGLGGSGLGGSGLGGSSLGRSGDGLGGSGPGGSGSSGSPFSADAGGVEADPFDEDSAARSDAPPRPGVLTTVHLDPNETLDGYTIHLPIGHTTEGDRYPILIFLQGAFGVGDRIEAVNDWGLARLLRDERGLDSRRNQLLRTGFIVVNPHIREGGYDNHPEIVRQILEDVIETHHGDRSRVYLTGLSRGGHGSYGLAEHLPGTFAAIAPIGGNSSRVEDWSLYAGTAVWISHNTADSLVSFDNARHAIDELEASLDVEFREFDHLRVNETDFLEHAHILTSAPTRSHDAWTEIYSHAEFYEWLLEQRLEW